MADLCGANAKTTGKPCTRPVVRGATRCRFHGGAAPQVKQAAERRLGLAAAEAAVKTYGLPVDVSPTEALLDEVKWTAGHVAWLREQVQATEREALAWGLTKREDHGATEFPGVNLTEQAVPNVWLELYSKERTHLLKVCATAIQCGIAERQVRLAEQQGAMIAQVLRAIFDELGLTPEQAVRVPEIAARHLRSVAA